MLLFTSDIKKLNELKKLIERTKISEANRRIKQLERQFLENNNLYLDFIYLKINLLFEQGLFEECIALVNKILDAKEFFLDKKDSIKLKLFQVDSYCQLAKFDEAMYMIDKIETIIRNTNQLYSDKENYAIKCQVILLKAIVFSYQDLEKAMLLLNESLELAQFFENTELVAQILYRKARVESYKGNLASSLLSLEECLSLAKQTNNSILVAQALVSLGEINRLKGDFGKALDLYNEALVIYQNMQNYFGNAITYNNIGIVHYSKGDINLAYEFFNKSLSYAKKINFKFIIAESSYYLVNITTANDQHKKAQEYLILSKENSDGLKSTMMYYYTLLSEAIVLKSENRIKQLGKAQENLELIIAQNTVYHEISVLAMLNLSELLLHELKMTSKMIILDEIEAIINRLLIIAEEQYSHSLLAESYWLKARFALFNAKVVDAQDYLIKAQTVAKKQNLENLYQRISKEYDLLLSEMEKWKQLANNDTSLEERIKESKVDNLIVSMINRATFELEEIENDEPELLLILNENGIPFFSLNFGDKPVNNLLMSGFLSAINNLVKEIFSSQGSIQLIEHQDYLLMFRNIETYIFCYVFKGSSYSARNKLNNFVKTILSSPLWEKLICIMETGRVPGKEKMDFLKNQAKIHFIK